MNCIRFVIHYVRLIIKTALYAPYIYSFINKHPNAEYQIHMPGLDVTYDVTLKDKTAGSLFGFIRGATFAPFSLFDYIHGTEALEGIYNEDPYFVLLATVHGISTTINWGPVQHHLFRN